MITTEHIKALRDETGVSVMQCKRALEEAGGDVKKARVILQKKGSEIAAKKGDRALCAGVVRAYVHNNDTVGALVVLLCETDFVAKNDEFKALAYDIAMHITAMNPTFLKREDVTEADQKNAKEVFAKEVADTPRGMREQILEGKLDAYFKDKILLEQTFIKDGGVTVGALIERAVQKFGERIEVARFSRLDVNT